MRKTLELAPQMPESNNLVAQIVIYQYRSRSSRAANVLEAA